MTDTPPPDDETAAPIMLAALPGLQLVLDWDDDDDDDDPDEDSFVVTAIREGGAEESWAFDEFLVACAHLAALGERVVAQAPSAAPAPEGDGEPVAVDALMALDLEEVQVSVVKMDDDTYVLGSNDWPTDDWLELPSFTTAVITAALYASDAAADDEG